MQTDLTQFIQSTISAIIAGLFVLAVERSTLSFRNHSKIQTGSNKFSRKWLSGLGLFAISTLLIVAIIGVLIGMTTKQLMFTVGYFSLGLAGLIIVFFSFVWPLLRVANLSQIPITTNPPPPTIDPDFLVSTSSPDVVPIIDFSKYQIRVTSNGDVFLRTVISSVAENNRKPIKALLPENFSIVETFKNDLRTANIYSVASSSTSADIIVLIDTSGSMNDPTDILNKKGEPLTKLEVAKDAVNLFFSDLSNSKLSTVNRQKSRIAFLSFSSRGVIFLESDDGDIWFSVQPESKAEVSKAIKKLTAEGDTPLYSAIAHAMTILEDTGDENYKLMFCLTDGLDTHSSIHLEQLLSRFQNNTTKIPVITVGYGQDGTYDANVLKNIALYSGAGQPDVGSFINVSPKDLSGVFTSLAIDLNNIYEIHWKSTFPKPGNIVTASVTAKFQLNTGQIISAREIIIYLIPISGK